MSINAATIIGGPALIKYKGATFYTKSDIKLESNKSTFNIEVDRFGKADERVSDEELMVTFTPSGEWEHLNILYPYRTALLGSLISPESKSISAVNTTDDELTVTANGLATGDDILLHSGTGGSLPTGLDNTTRYYVRVLDVDTLTLHPSLTDATNDTNKVDITSVGSGLLYIDRDHPLIIHTFDGIKLTLFNAAIETMPTISLSSIKTMLGDVKFGAYLRNGTSWSATTARWKIESEPLIDTSFDPADILTLPYTAAWGAVAPWNNFETKDGFEISFNVGLEPVTTDRLGTVTKRLKSVEASVKAQPMGINEQQMMEKLLNQGVGAKRGRSLSGDNLIISGPDSGDPMITIYGAALKNGPQSYGAGTDRIGQLDWSATRTFTAGTPNPLFALGVVA